jgi:hypothetical protein
MSSNQQRELEASNPETEQREKLLDQLHEVAVAEQFFEQATGKLFTQIATKMVDSYTREMLSNKFDNDHLGYLACKANINAYKGMLRRMQVAAHPLRKAKLEEKLEDGK